MGYCDYNFYKVAFMGNVIAESDFPRLCERASEELDLLTGNRLLNQAEVDKAVIEKSKKAVCAIAELFNDYDIADSAIRKAGGIRSMSSGSESVTYEDSASVLFSDKEKSRQIYRAAKKYLADTGLLYRGL